MAHTKKPRKKAANKTNVQKASAKSSKAKLAFSALAGKAAYDALLPQAKRLGAVPVSRVPPAIARTNVTTACKALAGDLANVSKIAPNVDTTLLAALPAIARAFEYAAGRVPKDASDGEIDKAIAVVSPLREATLRQLDVFAFCDLVDAGRVRKIHEGTGKLDMANDAVAIAGVFSDYATEVTNKHPFTEEQLDTLRERGEFLVSVLKPSNAPRDKQTRGPEATIKDQFSALLSKAYAEAEQVGAAAFGATAFRARIPALQSQARGKKQGGDTNDGGEATDGAVATQSLATKSS